MISQAMSSAAACELRCSPSLVSDTKQRLCQKPYHEQQIGHEEDCHLRSSFSQDVYQSGGVVDDGVHLVQ